MNYDLIWIPPFKKRSSTISQFQYSQDDIKMLWSLVHHRNSKSKPVLPLDLIHLKTAYIEDSIHDYSVRDNNFRYASRFSNGGHWLLIILDTKCPSCNKDMYSLGKFCTQCGKPVKYA